MLYKCKTDCFDSKQGILYKRGQIVPDVPDILKKHFIPLSVETETVKKSVYEEEFKELVAKLGLTPTGVKEIMKANHIKPGKGAEAKLVPILKDLLAKEDKE